MQVMVMVKATKSSEAGELPSETLLTEMNQFNEALVEAGIMKAGEGLKPSSEGVRVRFSGTNRTAVDGPFAETKELIAGYWLWEVASMEEAVAWVKRCPNPMLEDSDIEIRPLYEMADFAEVDTTGDIAKEEESLRDAIVAQSRKVQPYLFFAGRCEEALEFYQQTIGARVSMLLRYNESPQPLPDGVLQPGFENKIMHATFKVGDLTILASDVNDDKMTFRGFRLVLQASTEADAQRVFAGLADGGVVDLPLGRTFWSPCYGQVTDKFNVGWMVMVRTEES